MQTPHNFVNDLMPVFGKDIKSFGITEIFFAEGEWHFTSNFTLPADLIDSIETVIIYERD